MSFEISRKTGMVLSVTLAEKDLTWVFYIVDHGGRRSLIPKSLQVGERRNSEHFNFQSEATAFAMTEARRRNWID